MSNENQLAFYVFKDLRAKQNNNPFGNEVLRFDSLYDAIEAFREQPSEWSTSLGARVPSGGELDLVQRREGEPILCGDYQRDPVFYGDPEVRSAVRTLCSQLNIRWQSDYRVFGRISLLIPVVSELDSIRDRAINGKHLYPETTKYLFSAIKEMYVDGKGWTSTADVFEKARNCGYNCELTDKVSLVHVRYSDEAGHVGIMDIDPYNYILLQERAKFMEKDQPAMKALAEAIEEYISQQDMKLHSSKNELDVRNAPIETGSFIRIRDLSVQAVLEELQRGNVASLLEPIVSACERGFTTPYEQAEARELLGRVMNIPETDGAKIPLELRMRANNALESLYHATAPAKEQETNTKAFVAGEGR